jgi:stearoyl-CoA desaturase (Delta-9 desaturase)
MQSPKINWLRSIPFLLMHLSLLAVFWVPFRWEWVGLCLASYVIRMFAITAGYHRYFSHRSYKANRVVQFGLAWLGSTAAQKGVLWWAANHRMHHRHADRPQDIHSPIQRGFWWSHIGWIMSEEFEKTRWDQVQDLTKYPELKWLNRYHLIPVVSYAVLIFLWGGTAALVWGFFVSTVLLWHGTFTINSLSHLYGKVRYATRDGSRNNVWLALITLGEGWHNNHHCYMSSANQGFYWWEIDISYGILRGLSWLRLVSDLRKPPLAALEAKRLKPSRHTQMSIQPQGEKIDFLEQA